MPAALSASSLTPTSEFTCLLDYYAGRRAYRYLLHACSTTLTTAPSHPEARFYRAFALSCEQSSSEAIRELEQMVRENNGNGDYTLAATAAIIAAYRGGRGRLEKEGLEKWKEQLKALSKTSDVPSLLIAGRYFLHARKDKQAKQCLEKLLSRQPSHGQAATYLAMLQARTGNSRWIKKAGSTVETLLSALASGSEQRVDINAALLGSLILTDRRDWQRAVQHLNSVIVAYPSFTPALVEKSSLLFLQREYEESLVLSYRVVQRDNQHVFALFAIVLYFLVKEGAGSVSAKERLSDLQSALDKCEPANDFLYAHWATIIARLTHRNRPILQMTLQMLQTVSKQKANAGSASASAAASPTAASPSSPSAPLLIEQAYQYFLMDDLVTASSLYQQASKLEDSSEDGAGGGGREGEGGKAADGGGSAHMQALIGLIRIKLRSGRWKEASEELDFLSDLTGSQVLSNAANEERKEREGDASRLEVGLLRATLAYHWERDVAKASALLLEWAVYHRKLQQLAGGVDWEDPYSHHYDLLLALQPHLIVEVVQLALFLLPSEPAQHGDPPSPLLSSCLSLLSLLLAVIPGHLHAQILQAKLLYLAADFTAASASISTALSLDATNASAHLLCSYLALQAEDYKQSSAELEQARSYDFDVRNTAHYHVLKARLLVASGQLDDAAKVLLAAMELPGVKRPEGQAAATTGKTAGKRLSGKGLSDAAASSAASSVGRAAFPLTDDDRLSIFLELAGVYSALGQLPEASRTMAEAQAAFASSSSSSSAATRLLMAEVDLHCKRKEFDAALTLLRTVDADSRFYTRAKVRMADIFLHHKKSRAAFIAAFVDLCTVAPSLHNLGLLAEAHMAVQEPEAAIATYERALEAISTREREQEGSVSSSASDSGDDGSLTVSAIYSRIGQAMIATHDYRRAVEYYEEAVRGEEERDRQREERGLRPHPHVCLLLQDLAALYHRIKQYDDAAATVAKALEASKAKRSTSASTQGQSDTYGVDDVALLQLDVKSWTLLSAVHRANSADEALLAALNTAFSLQTQLLSLLPSSSPQLAAEREVSSSLSHQLASYYQAQQANSEQAVLHYHEALKTSPSSIPSLLALSQLHFALNEYDAAQQTLLSLLRIQPEHAEASLLLAELMYEKSEYDAAIYHFTQLLDREQGRYEALSKMISCLRRSGRLQDAPKYIAICEKAVTGAADSGSGSKAKSAAAEGKGADAAAGGKRRGGSDDDIVHYPTAPRAALLQGAAGLLHQHAALCPGPLQLQPQGPRVGPAVAVPHDGHLPQPGPPGPVHRGH